MTRVTPYLRALALALTAAGIAPQRSSASEPLGSPWHATLGVEQGYTNNVRWAENGPNKEDAFFTTVDAALGWDNDGRRRMPEFIDSGIRTRLYEQFSNRDFIELYTALSYEVGRSDVFLEYEFVPEHLRLDDDEEAGDVHASNHELVAGTQRKFLRGKPLRVRAQLETEWDDAEGSFDERDSTTVAGELNVRYRFNDLFVPRIAIRYGERNAKSANYDRQEFTIETGFDSHPFENVYLAARYKRLMRDYTVDDEVGADGKNSNFDRKDDADQVEIRILYDITRVRGLRLVGKYKLRDNDSTRDSRNFEVQEASLGLEYALR